MVVIVDDRDAAARSRTSTTIAAVPGVDVLWIGHYDLTASLGIPGQFDHPDFREALDSGRRGLRANGIAAGISTDSLADATRAARGRASASSPTATTSSCCATALRDGHRRASRRPSPSRDPRVET